MDKAKPPTRLIWYLCPLLAALLNDTALGIVVDDFSVGPISLVHSGSEIHETQLGLDPAHVVGGSRSIGIGIFGGNNIGQTVEIDTDSRTFAFESGPSLGYLSLDYGSASSPLNLDLTADGSDRLVLTFVDVDPLSAINSINVRLFAAPGFVGRTVNFTDTQVLSGGVTRRIAHFDQFGDLDLTNVQRIGLVVSRFNESFVLSSLVTVPEPHSAVLAFASILGTAVVLGRYRWSRGPQ